MAQTQQVEIESAPALQPLPRRAGTPPQLRQLPPHCPLCGCTDARLAFRDNGCALRACPNCGLFFLDPCPARAQQHFRIGSGDRSRIRILDCARRYAGERLFYDRHFDLIAEECRGASSLLDVGCGTGHLLERLAAIPDLCRAGLDIDPEAVGFARRVAGCDIYQVPFERFRSSRQFDVITMINVFSHVPSFDAMFASVRAVLRPGGKLILRTSEMAANVSRWNQFHWGIPDDLHFLGLRTLDFICAKYRLAILRHVRTPYEDELFRISRWQQMGRNAVVNLTKRAAIGLPGFLSLARTAYENLLGRRLFISFIVLTPAASQEKG